MGVDPSYREEVLASGGRKPYLGAQSSSPLHSGVPADYAFEVALRRAAYWIAEATGYSLVEATCFPRPAYPVLLFTSLPHLLIPRTELCFGSNRCLGVLNTKG